MYTETNTETRHKMSILSTIRARIKTSFCQPYIRQKWWLFFYDWHPHIWNKSLMYLRKMKQNAFFTGLLYFIHSWTTSRHRARKWNKTYIWTILRNETNHLYYCFLENETKRICIHPSRNHLPYPLLFSRKWNKTLSSQSR